MAHCTLEFPRHNPGRGLGTIQGETQQGEGRSGLSVAHKPGTGSSSEIEKDSVVGSTLALH